MVPLTIPWTRSIVAPASDSWSTRITGTTPATAPSKRSCTLVRAGRLPQLLAVLREQLLVGGDDVAAGAHRRAARTRAPARSRRSARRSDPSARADRRTIPARRVSTPGELGAQAGDPLDPVGVLGAAARRTRRRRCRGRAARRGTSRSLPTSRRGQVVVGLAPDDARAPRRRGRRSPAGAARRCSCWPARSRRRRWPGVAITSPGSGVGQRDVADDHVAGFAVLAGQRGSARSPGASGRSAITASYTRAVQHRPQVVRHPAVDRDPGRDVALDRLDRVQGHRRVGDQRAARLEQQPLVRRRARSCTRRRSPSTYSSIVGGLLGGGVGDAEAAAEVVDRELAERRDRRDRARNGSSSNSCEPMWKCSPTSSRSERAGEPARSPRAPRRSRSRTSSPPGRSRSRGGCRRRRPG